MARLKELFKKEIKPSLMTQFGYKKPISGDWQKILA